jgi:selenoprotein W-related protein
LTEELVRAYGRKITNLALQPAGGGVFEVTYNGELIFSKKKLDRFPEQGEIVGLIDQRR